VNDFECQIFSVKKPYTVTLGEVDLGHLAILLTLNIHIPLHSQTEYLPISPGLKVLVSGPVLGYKPKSGTLLGPGYSKLFI
jgi:hypothetical protein